MSEILTLTRAELASLYGFNKYIHMTDKKDKSRYRLLFFAVVLVALMTVFYLCSIAYGFSLLGMASILPSYIVFLTSVIILFFGVFKAGHRIFSPSCYDILSSMPIKARSIVTARVISLYAEELAVSSFIMLPPLITGGVIEGYSPAFYILSFIAVLFVPVIPLILSSFIGTVFFALSLRAKHKSLIQSILSVAFVIAVLLSTSFVGNISDDIDIKNISLLIDSIKDIFTGIYPLSVWTGNGILGKDMLGYIISAVLSVLFLAAFVILLTPCFHGVMRGLLSVSSEKKRVKLDVGTASPLIALYKRELKRYFSSSIYLTNTIVGPILGAVMSIVLCFGGLDDIRAALPQTDIADMVPIAVGAVFTMMTTTSVSISLEGKWFWQIRSLPIPQKVFFDSKILMNLSMIAPFYLVSQICLIIALKPTPLQLLWNLLYPAAIILLAVIAGITVNLKFCNLSWEKEEQVVKQSASSAIGGFLGLFASLIPAALLITAPPVLKTPCKIIIIVSLLILALFFYKGNNKKSLTDL